MSDSKYIDIYNDWQRKSIKEGFTQNQFRNAVNMFISVDERCEMTKAIAAKMAYRSLKTTRINELELVQKEMENIQWL